MKLLTLDQDYKARMWRMKHFDHVKHLIELAEKAYPPTLTEDKNNPAIWKPEYWKWFANQMDVIKIP